jgi:hypothetical protein
LRSRKSIKLRSAENMDCAASTYTKRCARIGVFFMIIVIYVVRDTVFLYTVVLIARIHRHGRQVEREYEIDDLHASNVKEKVKEPCFNE